MRNTCARVLHSFCNSDYLPHCWRSMQARLALVLAALLRVQYSARRRAPRGRRPWPCRRCLTRCCRRSALLCTPARGSSACSFTRLCRACLASGLGRPYGAGAAVVSTRIGALLPSELPRSVCLSLRLRSHCAWPALPWRCAVGCRLACAACALARGSTSLAPGEKAFCSLLLRSCAAEVQHMLVDFDGAAASL